MKKTQIITFDLLFSMVLFILLVMLFVSMYFLEQKSAQDYDYELDYVFANFENNLEAAPSPNGVNIDFLNNFRVDRNKLDSFAMEFYSDNIKVDEYVIGRTGNAHGIGLSTEVYDACIYFVDNDNSRIEFTVGLNSFEAIGNLESGSCHNIITTSGNPCHDYAQGISFLKPVLLDENNPNLNKIIQMNIILCKK